MVSRRPGGIG